MDAGMPPAPGSAVHEALARLAAGLAGAGGGVAVRLADALRTLTSRDGGPALLPRPERLAVPPPELGPWVLERGGTYARGAGAATAWPAPGTRWSGAEAMLAEPGRFAVRRTARERIVLIGESVARGFYLDGVVSLAAALEDGCRARDPGRGWEVVDLALNNLELGQALELCEASSLLDATVLVVYAGNNWTRSCEWLGRLDDDAGGSALGRAGHDDLVAIRGLALRRLAAEFAGFLGDWRARTGARVVMVIPEVNRTDWRSLWRVPFWLPAAELARWLAAAERLRAMEDRAEPGDERVTEAALELLAIDGRGTERALELAALGVLRRGDAAEARALYDRSMEVGARSGPGRARRCAPLLAGALADACAAHGVETVELGAIFEARAAAEPARRWGRELFLDSCHHTPRGLAIAAGAIADAIAGPADAAGAPAATGDGGPRIADGLFLAAIHNAHWAQRRDVVRDLLRESVARDPRMEDRVAAHLLGSNRRQPVWALAAACEGPSSPLSWYLTNYVSATTLDVELGEAAAEALPAAAGAALRDRLLAARLTHLAVERHGPVDGLEQYWRPYDAWSERVPGIGVSREEQPVSEFAVVAEGAADLRCALIVRTAPPVVAGTAAASFNGAPLATLELDAGWRRYELHVPGELVVAGVNTLRLAWTAPPVDGPDPMRGFAELAALRWSAPDP